MKHGLRQHLGHMAVAAAVIVGLLLVAGVEWSDALRWAVLLACPLGMVGMMWMMGRQHGQPMNHHGSTRPEQDVTLSEAPARGDGSPAERLGDQR